MSSSSTGAIVSPDTASASLDWRPVHHTFSTSFADKNGDAQDEQAEDDNSTDIKPAPVFAAYPVGDWHLQHRDGGACKGDKFDYKDAVFPNGFPSMMERKGYGGELQLIEEYRTPSLLFSDLTNSALWTCSADIKTKNEHPQLEFRYPNHKIHVHLEDKADPSSGKVIWDAIYDIGGTEYLRGTAKPLGGTKPEFEKICPSQIGPPHWYELTVSRQGPAGAKPHMVQDFIAAQVVSAYRPDHDPELTALELCIL